ncbi:MAG: prolipoprotein diacylglyceryl transferase [Clostridia bacterium]|nr:prolipoprotein diacylglyceryl transferase [Clostridia bacterium]
MEQLMAFIRENIYVIMAAFGAISAVVIVVDNFKGAPYEKKQKSEIVIIGILSLLVCLFLANLANWFFFRDNMFAAGKNYSFVELFERAGFTFYAGLFVFCGALALLLKLRRYDVKKLFYYIVPAIPLFHGIARVGCAIDGCCYGIPINLQIGDFVISNFPTQFCESLFLFILFYLLEYKIKKARTITYFTSYAVFRFLIEFLRGDDRGYLIRNIPLSPSQQMAIIVIAVALIYLIFTRYGKDAKAKRALLTAAIILPCLLFSIVSSIIVTNARAKDKEDLETLVSEYFIVLTDRSKYDFDTASATAEEIALYKSESATAVKAFLTKAYGAKDPRYITLTERSMDLVLQSLKDIDDGKSGLPAHSLVSLDKASFGGSYLSANNTAYAEMTVQKGDTTVVYAMQFLNAGGRWTISYIYEAV